MTACDNVPGRLAPKTTTTGDPINNSIFYSRFDNLLVDFNTYAVSNSPSGIDKIQLSENTRALNLFAKASYDLLKDATVPFATQYPNIYNRIENATVITQIETLEFINENLFEFTTFPSYVSVPGNKPVLTLLDNFYSPESISRSSIGSFCDLIQSIFGAVAGIFELYKDIAEFASNLPDLINKIQNFSAAGLLEALKTRILSTVDKIVEKARAKLKNFGLDFLDDDYNYNKGPIYSKVESSKSNAEKFFSSVNIENIKKRIEGLIAYIVSLFEDPDIEEIQFIVYRFCKLISEIENLFNGVFAPLQAIRNDYQTSQNVLKARSGYNSAFAMSAGAVRFTEDQRTAGVSQGNQVIQDVAPAGAIVQPASSEEVGGLPRWEDIRSSTNRDSRIVLAPNNSGDVYIARGSNRNMSSEAWNKCTVDAKVTLMRFQQRLSQALGRNVKFYINSAYRSLDYNTAIGGAKESLHMAGGAFDISTTASAGFSSADRDTFIQVARESGFRGIGRYNTFIHVDIGPARTWGSF